MLIKGFEKEEPQGNRKLFNGKTLEWKSVPIRDLSKKTLVDEVIPTLFAVNVGLKSKIKEYEDTQRIIKPI